MIKKLYSVILILQMAILSSTSYAQFGCTGATCLDSFRTEMTSMMESGLTQDGMEHSTGGNLGVRYRATNPRLREDQGAGFPSIPLSNYLNYDEEAFESSTEMPLDYMGSLNKTTFEQGYLNGGAAVDRINTGLNSAFGSYYQTLMFQEPTIAQAGMNIKSMWDTTLASYQADRANELLHRQTMPKIARQVLDDIDRCVADGVSGLGGLGGSDLDTVRQQCQSQASLQSYLNARNAQMVSTNGMCEWSSIVMFGHLGVDVPMRMRAVFGDDELCANPINIGSPISSFSLYVVPPEVSMRRAWWEEYDRAIIDVEEILERAATENGGYQLLPSDLVRLSIRPSVKVSQALITAIEDGLDPLKEKKELVHWWATEKANALFDFVCSEAEIHLHEAAASPATPTEHARWKKKVDAVCSVREEVKKEMALATHHEEIFAKILAKGDRATSRAASATVARATRERSTARRSFGSPVPAEDAQQDFF